MPTILHFSHTCVLISSLYHWSRRTPFFSILQLVFQKTKTNSLKHSIFLSVWDVLHIHYSLSLERNAHVAAILQGYKNNIIRPELWGEYFKLDIELYHFWWMWSMPPKNLNIVDEQTQFRFLHYCFIFDLLFKGKEKWKEEEREQQVLL